MVIPHIIHALGPQEARDMMPTTPSFGEPTGIKLNPGQVPAFTADDMKIYLQSKPSCSLGPTLSGEPPTVESIEFVPSGELRDRLSLWIGLPDDALACFVVLRGPFLLKGISYAPGTQHSPAYCQMVGEIYDARTGRLLVKGVNAFRSSRCPGE